MSVLCPPEIFKQFEDGCGGDVSAEGEVRDFLYDALGEGFDFTGFIPLAIPDLDDKSFEDWQQFEYWCENMRLELMWKLVDVDDEKFNDAYENSSPKAYFQSKDAVKEKIIATLCSSSEESSSVVSVEIESNSKKLYLIYEDSMEWELGHGDTVLVVKSLDELTPEMGFYPLI